MGDRLERVFLAFVRRVILLVAVLVLVGGIAYLIFIAAAYLKSSPTVVAEPSVSSSFNAPAISPVERFALSKKIEQCADNYQVKFDGAADEYKLTVKIAREKSREIRNRFMELIDSDRNTPREIAKLYSDQEVEASSNCAEAKAAQSAIYSDLRDDRKDLATRFGVAVDSCGPQGSAAGLDALISNFPLPSECSDAHPILIPIVRNLRDAYPADCGLDGGKYDLARDVKSVYESFIDDTDIEYAQSYFQGLESYTANLKSYFVGQQEALEQVNQLNSDSVVILCESVTEYVNEELDRSYESYHLAKELEAAASAGFHAEQASVLSQLVLLAGVPGVLLILALLLAYFAIERHLRNSK